MSEVGNPFPKLPHGRPFLLVDRVLEVGDRHGTFLKLVTATDPCTGSDGTLPTAFVLEALAQAGGALLGAIGEQVAEAGYLAAVDGFEMRSEARVGDELRIEVELVREFATATLFRGRARVGDRLVAEGRFTLALPR
jgi:UDP-3-O-[3-hydroxymyristoyl] N-acetylglucosamine deacetylase/3-hydroxyacyl-[acyl-carrier-protein] dehydratase